MIRHHRTSSSIAAVSGAVLCTLLCLRMDLAVALEQPATVPSEQPRKSIEVQPAQDSRKQDPIAAQLTDKVWLGEVTRHLYRWYLEERDVVPLIETNLVDFWVREIKPTLDEGDKSQFGEVVLPQLKMLIRVKKADYQIPELNAVVKNESFMIVGISRLSESPSRPSDAVEIRIPYVELRDVLFRTRNQSTFPEGTLLERLRSAVRTRIIKTRPELINDAKEQVVFLAPLSPFANETWVFWETHRTLIHFSSDIDLKNPAVWEHESLAIEMIELDKKVVVSLDEVAGSNGFMTRDTAARVMFNCLVFGKRIELVPPATKVDPQTK